MEVSGSLSYCVDQESFTYQQQYYCRQLLCITKNMHYEILLIVSLYSLPVKYILLALYYSINIPIKFTMYCNIQSGVVGR